MKSRAELEEILAAQRANRNPHPYHSRKDRGSLPRVLTVIVILLASGAAMFFAVQWTTPRPEGAETTSLSASPTASTSALVSTGAPAAVKVCTEIPDGRLHVRFTAGDGGEVRGYLAEGEPVQVALDPAGELDAQIIKDNLWIRISFPVAGWVNAHYICELE
ncbi:MAG: hypothetical protein IPF48_12270 [Sphingomonadales bacterium]|nr:hypothetical protein [Sphingomonadales bacterium]